MSAIRVLDIRYVMCNRLGCINCLIYNIYFNCLGHSMLITLSVLIILETGYSKVINMYKVLTTHTTVNNIIEIEVSFKNNKQIGLFV